MQKTTFPTLRAFVRPLVLIVASLALVQCAALSGSSRGGAKVEVASTDRLFLTIEAFGPEVVASLEEAGLDPIRFAEDFEGELRYQLYLRGQEEARDSLSASVRVTVSVRRLIPGTGNTGTWGLFAVTADRGSEPQRAQWEWEVRARDNVPAPYLARHLPRAAASQVLTALRPPRANTQHAPGLDTPPPLILIR